MFALLSSGGRIACCATAAATGAGRTIAFLVPSKHRNTVSMARMEQACKFGRPPPPPQRRVISTTSPRQQQATTSAKATSEASSSSSSSSSTRPKSFVEWYEGHIKERPVITKMITGAFLWGLGDVVGQLVPLVMGDEGKDKKKIESLASSSDSPLEYDWPRTGRAIVFGFALHAPTAHVHYNFLEWMTVRVGIRGGVHVPLFKAFMEQFVYWSWLSNSMYHGAMGAMQGHTPSQIYQRIADVLWETQKAQWIFWIPVQLLNFRFVPVRHQLNVVLVTSIVWTALLSAWYPPEKKRLEEDQQELQSRA